MQVAHSIACRDDSTTSHVYHGMRLFRRCRAYQNAVYVDAWHGHNMWHVVSCSQKIAIILVDGGGKQSFLWASLAHVHSLNSLDLKHSLPLGSMQ